MIKEIKSIPLATFLSSLGHEPVKRNGTRLWYKSPLRQEHTASFKVETSLNCWYDFGIGKGGDIIDLAKQLFQSSDLRYVMKCIVDRCPVSSVQTVASSFATRQISRQTAPRFEDIEIVPLRSHALLAYLQARGIPSMIATAQCQEAHYSCNGRRYYAVAFANIAGGYEVRNRYFKGCLMSKHISICRVRDGPSTEVAVFEGFMDYLSALTLGILETDAVILNSVSNVNKAIPYLADYSVINCYLDNDDAGKTALAQLTTTYGTTVVDRSTLYTGFNDLNEYLVNPYKAVDQQNKIINTQNYSVL